MGSHMACARLLRSRLFDPDACPCLWSKKCVNKCLARAAVGILRADEDFYNHMVQLSGLFTDAESK